MTITHNQIIKLFSDIATNHKQINDWGFGKNFDIGAERKIIYPLMWGDNNPSSIADNVMLSNYSLYFLDRVKQDQSNEDEIISDQLLIAQDVLAILCSDTYDSYFDCQRSAQISEFFSEYLDDVLVGVKLDISLRIFYDTNRCQIPISSIPTIEIGLDSVITGIQDTIDNNSPYGIIESLA